MDTDKSQFLVVGSVWVRVTELKCVKYRQVIAVGERVSLATVIPSLYFGMWTPFPRSSRGKMRVVSMAMQRFYEEHTIVQKEATIDPPLPVIARGRAWAPIPLDYLKFLMQAAATIPGMTGSAVYREIAHSLATLENPNVQIEGTKLWSPENFTSTARRRPSSQKTKSS